MSISLSEESIITLWSTISQKNPNPEKVYAQASKVNTYYGKPEARNHFLLLSLYELSALKKGDAKLEAVYTALHKNIRADYEFPGREACAELAKACTSHHDAHEKIPCMPCKYYQASLIQRAKN